MSSEARITEEKENNDTHRHILSNKQEKRSYKFSENESKEQGYVQMEKKNQTIVELCTPNGRGRRLLLFINW